jgi:DNA end-binding protein Ku
MVKGVEVASGKYTAVAPDEIEAVAPASVHTIEIAELVPRGGIGWLFPDALYYLAPDGVAALAAFALIREGIAAARVAAIGQLCLGSREHLVTLEAGRKVLRLSTLRYAPETRDEELVFPKLAAMAAPESLVEPVGRILASLRTEAFDPARYTDRYARGLSALVLEKISGKMVKRAPTPPPKLLDLEKAVTRSANLAKTRRRA